jgi:RNA polymerase sigma-B factor
MSANPAETERAALVERHMPLARSLAHRYRHAREPLADLEQVAYLALIKAVDGFDPARGTAFSTYAVPYIAGAIKRHFRDFAWPVHVPRGAKDLGTVLDKLSDQIWESTGRPPTAAQLARAAGTSIENVIEARQAWDARYCSALDQPLRDDDPDGPAPSTGWRATTRGSRARSSANRSTRRSACSTTAGGSRSSSTSATS